MAGESLAFIPKTTLSRPAYREQGLGFLSTISVAIFLVSLGVLSGSYLYSGLLDSDLKKLHTDLEKTKKEFEVSSIRNFSQMANTINLAKTVIGSHVAVSQAFAFVQDNTLQSTRFLDFSFGGEKGNSLALGGEATSFSALAEQAHVFGTNKFVRSITLSDISLRKSGNVGFSMAMMLDASLTNYGGGQ
jgi:hypothetical protein